MHTVSVFMHVHVCVCMVLCVCICTCVFMHVCAYMTPVYRSYRLDITLMMIAGNNSRPIIL